MATAITVRRAEGTALDDVERLLSAADLPTADLRDEAGRFYVATAGGDLVGAGGLEVHGSAGLLRSVVVEPGARGEGYGTAICDELEARAREAGVDELYLLTATAREFFADRGYRGLDREEAPAAIRSTTEFAELCPESAACMVRDLGG
jgi:amino-acid N-acetyltransferase